MAELLKGGPAAKAVTEDLIFRCKALKENGTDPCLAILRIGERDDDRVDNDVGLIIKERTVCEHDRH